MNTKLAPAALRPVQEIVCVATHGLERTRKPRQTVKNLFLFLVVCFGFTSLRAQTITYHGGWVVPSSHVYFIWYGNWNGDTGSIILPDLINGMNGSAYLNVLTSYTGKIFVNSSQNTFGPVTTNVTFGGQVWDWYSYGTVLDEPTTKDLIQSHLPQFGTDPDGVYFLFTSADVDFIDPAGEHFCNNVCGYHNHTFRDNINMLHAVVGNPQRCKDLGLDPCRSQDGASPNDNPNADGMATTIAHEYAEIVTDPNADSWFYINTAGEMGDLCQFPNDFNATYGPTFLTGNGSRANVTLGSRNFLLQQLWVSTGGCTLSYTPPPPPGGGGGDPGGGCAMQPLPTSSAAQAASRSSMNPLGSTAANVQPNQPVNGKQPKAPSGPASLSGVTAAPPGQVRCTF